MVETQVHLCLYCLNNSQVSDKDEIVLSFFPSLSFRTTVRNPCPELLWESLWLRSLSRVLLRDDIVALLLSQSSTPSTGCYGTNNFSNWWCRRGQVLHLPFPYICQRATARVAPTIHYMPPAKFLFRNSLSRWQYHLWHHNVVETLLIAKNARHLCRTSLSSFLPFSSSYPGSIWPDLIQNFPCLFKLFLSFLNLFIWWLCLAKDEANSDGNHYANNQ